MLGCLLSAVILDDNLLFGSRTMLGCPLSSVILDDNLLSGSRTMLGCLLSAVILDDNLLSDSRTMLGCLLSAVILDDNLLERPLQNKRKSAVNCCELGLLDHADILSMEKICEALLHQTDMVFTDI